MAQQRKDLTLQEKCDLIQRFDNLPKNISQREAANRLMIAQSSLCRILRRRDEILENYKNNGKLNRKRNRGSKEDQVDQALLEWFTQAKLSNTPIKRGMLAQKAKDFAAKFGNPNFKPSDGWLGRWKDRNNITLSASSADGQNDEPPHTWLSDHLPTILNEYPPHQIFTMGETALYYQAMPSTSHYQNENSIVAKARVQILFACNMMGTIKIEPLMVGKIANPRCFQGVNKLPVTYDSNKSAWVSKEIITTFLYNWNKTLGNEKIALVFDCWHRHIDMTFTNIKLFSLPPNAPYFQPLDQGIIKTFKSYYRKFLWMKAGGSFVDGLASYRQKHIKPSLLDTAHTLLNAWDQVTQSCIINSFKRAGFFQPGLDGIELQDSGDLTNDYFCQTFGDWIAIDDNIKTDEKIIEGVQSTPQTVDEVVNDDPFFPPSCGEVEMALSIIRRFLDHKGTKVECYRSFYKVEQNIYELLHKNTPLPVIVNMPNIANMPYPNGHQN